MNTEDLYNELKNLVSQGEQLVGALDTKRELTFRHLEWGEHVKVIIGSIDPYGEIYDKSSPVGMYYDGWNLATFPYPDKSANERMRLNALGFARALGALKGIIKVRPAPRPQPVDKSKELAELRPDIEALRKRIELLEQRFPPSNS